MLTQTRSAPPIAAGGGRNGLASAAWLDTLVGCNVSHHCGCAPAAAVSQAGLRAKGGAVVMENKATMDWPPPLSQTPRGGATSVTTEEVVQKQLEEPSSCTENEATMD